MFLSFIVFISVIHVLFHGVERVSATQRHPSERFQKIRRPTSDKQGTKSHSPMDDPSQSEDVDVIELPPVAVDNTPDPLRSFSLSLRSVQIELCSLGASITKFLVASETEKGKDDDIVLGYKDVATMYHTGNPVYFSAVVGRVANRIAKGRFSLEGKPFKLEINNSPNHLHGGSCGFNKKNWKASIVNSGVQFSLHSPDGDQGYPGAVQVTATYTLRKSLSSSTGVILGLKLHAVLLDKDKSTPINLSQHSYFNLAGQDEPKGIIDHSLSVEADAYTPVDSTSIPTREIRHLNSDATMDWRKERSLRESLEAFGMEKVGLPLEAARKNLKTRAPGCSETPYGFDHNYVVRKPQDPDTSTTLPKVASLSYKARKLTVYSNAPGVQIYTANYLGENENESICKSKYGPWSGICMETQHFPDSILEAASKTASDEFAAGKCPILTPSDPEYSQNIEYHLEVH